MQGSALQQLSKSASGAVKTPGMIDGKQSAKVNGKIHAEGEQVEVGAENFASLFASVKGESAEENPKKNSAVKSETGETLKNLLVEKKSENSAEESKKIIHPQSSKLIEVESESINNEQKLVHLMDSLKIQAKENKTDSIGDKIAKGSSNLDQLLNNLKGNQESGESIIDSGDKKQSGNIEIKSPIHKNDIQKNELKSQSPLEFLLKESKLKDVGEASVPESENLSIQKKVVTGEDYLNALKSSEKKAPVLTLIDGKIELDQSNQLKGKQPQLSIANYGQGMALLNDPLIKSTKDLTNKDIKRERNSLGNIDEVLTKDTKVSAELASIKQAAIPELQNNKENHSQNNTQTNANQKILDLSQIQTTNTNEIIKRISDYVEQNQVANKQSLDLTVKHDSLGEFKIQVSKMPDSMNRGLNQIDMQITTSSREGHDFFVKNETGLLKNLNQAGINLSDLRIVSSMSESTPFGQSDSRQSSSFGQSADGQSKQFMSFESSRFSSGDGAEKRKELWEEYQQRYGA